MAAAEVAEAAPVAVTVAAAVVVVVVAVAVTVAVVVVSTMCDRSSRNRLRNRGNPRFREKQTHRIASNRIALLLAMHS